MKLIIKIVNLKRQYIYNQTMHMLEPVIYLGILTKVNLFESTTHGNTLSHAPIHHVIKYVMRYTTHRPGRLGIRWHSDRIFRIFGFSGLRS